MYAQSSPAHGCHGMIAPQLTRVSAVLAVLAWNCRGDDVTSLTGAEASGSTVSPDAASAVNELGAVPSESGPVSSGPVSSPTRSHLACGSGRLTAAGREQIARRPYLQNVTSTSASVLLTTRVPNTNASLHLLGADGTLREVDTELDQADGTGHQRRAVLGGLQSATAYCYQVENWTESVAFSTAPPIGAGGSVRFIAFGDSGGDSRESVRREMDRVPFDLMLHVGDIAYERGKLSEFESKFFATYADLIARVPIFAASGNHEYYTADAAPYREVFELPANGAPQGVERWFSFDWGDVHFVALDTERVGPEQAKWLEGDLGRAALRWKVVYMHKPPYSSGVHGSSLSVRELFSPLFERFGVQLVLSGHDHNYERTDPIGGVTYIVTGGGGKSLRPVGSSDFTAHSESTFHFVHGELQGETLSLRAIDTSGEVIDSTRISRDGAFVAQH